MRLLSQHALARFKSLACLANDPMCFQIKTRSMASLQREWIVQFPTQQIILTSSFLSCNCSCLLLKSQLANDFSWTKNRAKSQFSPSKQTFMCIFNGCSRNRVLSRSRSAQMTGSAPRTANSKQQTTTSSQVAYINSINQFNSIQFDSIRFACRWNSVVFKFWLLGSMVEWLNGSGHSNWEKLHWKMDFTRSCFVCNIHNLNIHWF